ncbi:sialidase family protein [Maritimibacter sp. DP1N21-5]|uniref:WD40/YVTN/BNR-like repeat-containing protein n=1 Tax=Maritimibacter sp. DP1N21-5 TaxID=2836867 RepID=UPI001C463B36|nr:sialidase family protein [Maritimibacter sp. DP1N21-5]MBV7407689.1 exo-alpha-sialidase [Maritimibacter sp. DP1N21-5]
MSEPLRVLVGTTKGVFVLTSNDDRETWNLDGPHCDLWTINHVIGDPTTGEMWAGGGSDWSGAGVWHSGDQGKTWSLAPLTSGDMFEWAKNDPEAATFLGVDTSATFPFDKSFSSVWSLARVGGRLYAGTKPAMLLTSADSGESWQEVTGLREHPSSDSWQPGGAGLTLHTILTNEKTPDQLRIAISAAGVFATEDGGTTWERMNRLDNDMDQGHHHHDNQNEIGHCVHNMIGNGEDGALIYQQNHSGVFRSRDGGRSWHDITGNLPSTFGFPIAADPHDPSIVWTIPLNGDMQGRYPPDAAAAVWRSTDAGETWQDMREGLPQKGCFFTVLRQAMATDRSPETGVYFGTNSGSIFASTDRGRSWTEIARHLPTVLSVETL